VFFSWVCMFCYLMFLFVIRSRSPLFRRGGPLSFSVLALFIQSQFSSSPSTSQLTLPRSTFPLVR
jgi:hypothetical protein